MNTIIAVIILNKNGQAVRATVTDGVKNDSIPISNTPIEKVKKLLSEIYPGCEFWTSQEVKSDGTR